MTNQQDTALLPVAEALRPCPHCGKTDAFVERADFSSCYVMCNDCCARGPVSCDETEEDAEATDAGAAEPGEMAARRLWNTRTEQAKPSASCEVERVARAIYEAEPIPPGMEAVFGYEAQKALNGPEWVVYAKARAAIAALSERGVVGEGAERYLSDRFEWAAPGDQQEDAWLVRFCDKDCGEAIFTGPEAERDAWEYWNRYAPSYNLYVFRLAALASGAGDDLGASGGKG